MRYSLWGAQVLGHHCRREAAELIALSVVTRQHQQHTGGRIRFGNIHAFYARMCVWGKYIHAETHVGQNDIVDVPSLSRNESLIFYAAYRLPNSELHLRIPYALRLRSFVEKCAGRALNGSGSISALR